MYKQNIVKIKYTNIEQVYSKPPLTGHIQIVDVYLGTRTFSLLFIHDPQINFDLKIMTKRRQ